MSTMSTNQANSKKILFRDCRFEAVLISADQHRTGRERIVLACHSGSDMYIPLDRGREANQELLRASQVVIRWSDHHDHCDLYQVRGHRPLSPADRECLDTRAYRPVSKTTDVLCLVRNDSAKRERCHVSDQLVAVADEHAA